MKRFQKILVLCLAMMLVLSLAACGDKKVTKKKDFSSEQIVRSAPCMLYVRVDVELSVGFDENGKALAVSGSDERAAEVAAACGDISGMTGAEAITKVLETMQQENVAMEKQYVIIRQNHNTVLPNDKFLDEVRTAAEKLFGEGAVIAISAADMDDDGYFTAEVAQQILQAHVGEGVKILATSTMIDGCYIISCEENNDISDFSVSGYSGAIALADELVENPADEEASIPEDQQFDITEDYTDELESAEDLAA